MTLVEWARYHVKAFGLTGPQIEAVAAWLPIFERAGWAADELRVASDWLILHDAPAYFPKSHLDGLKARVMAGRALEQSRDVDALTGEDRPVCSRCGGAGRLVVPDLRSVRGGEWRPRATACSVAWDTCAVRCPGCRDGRERHYGTVTLGRVQHDLMTLEAYELANPSWQRQLEARRREEIALAELDPPPAKEEGLNEVLAALRDRCRMPGEDDREPDGGAGEWREGGAGW